MPARWTIRWRARSATGTTRATCAAWTTRIKRAILPAAKTGHHFARFFRFTFRANRGCFFIHAHGHNLEFLFTLIAFIFIYRHNLVSFFWFNLELEQANVNIYHYKGFPKSNFNILTIIFFLPALSLRILKYKIAVFIGGTVSLSFLIKTTASSLHLVTQRPHPMQRSRSTRNFLSSAIIASIWQRSTQTPQPLHKSASMRA